MNEVKDTTNDVRDSESARGGDQSNLAKAARDLGNYASIFAGTGLAFNGARHFGRRGVIIVGAGLMILGGRMLYKTLTMEETPSKDVEFGAESENPSER